MTAYRPRHRAQAGKEFGPDWNPHNAVSEEELLNRVILAKSLIALCSGSTVHLRTKTEDAEITPKIARRLLRLAKTVDSTQRG
jgi:hypothetical protein